MNEQEKYIFKDIESADRWPDLILLGIVFIMSAVYVILSGNHPYNFDEFQVLYASASLVRGKALYMDQVDGHFPFFNIAISFLIHLIGFKAIVILIGRYFILLINMITLFYVYRIGEILWNRRTGMIAIILVLSSYVFLSSGVEIRHDIFNMAFNVMGAYYGIRYLKEKKIFLVLISGIFLGLAFASTQKAIVWIIAIVFGMLLCISRRKSYMELLKISFTYVVAIPIPLIFSIFYLLIANHESLLQFIHRSVINVIFAFAPFTEELYPFPFSRYNLLKDLIYQNHLLYGLAIGGIIVSIIFWFKTNSHRIVIAVWALVGVIFYVTAKRPFFQTFLPSVPPLCILAAGLLCDMFKELKTIAIHKKVGISIAAICLLLVWPLCMVWGQLSQNPKMTRQIANVSFCLENLTKDDKVLCFTQNQIFFDPVMRISNEECGERIYDYDADCFERKMKKEQCKIIINDYRTGLLNQKIQEKILLNYIPTKIGDILIPGFKIAPHKVVNKEVWINGHYYSPTLALEVDGEKIDGNLIELKQGKSSFKNLSDRPVTLVYIFKPESIMNKHVGLKIK